MTVLSSEPPYVSCIQRKRFRSVTNKYCCGRTVFTSPVTDLQRSAVCRASAYRTHVLYNPTWRKRSRTGRAYPGDSGDYCPTRSSRSTESLRWPVYGPAHLLRFLLGCAYMMASLFQTGFDGPIVIIVIIIIVVVIRFLSFVPEARVLWQVVGESLTYRSARPWNTARRSGGGRVSFTSDRIRYRDTSDISMPRATIHPIYLLFFLFREIPSWTSFTVLGTVPTTYTFTHIHVYARVG